jgi:NAD(P)-dependent dehydrogenase (short-subunit alcohol dehydrogenase family)
MHTRTGARQMKKGERRMHGRVANKIALVTGAASGLGAETARRLAGEGALVMLTDRDPTVADVATAIGDRADHMLHDVTSEADWAAVVARTTERFGPLSILVNNAGVAGSSLDLLTHSLEDWRRILSINLDGVFLGLRHCGGRRSSRRAEQRCRRRAADRPVDRA